jgi:16S rRNA (guanine527-N7)-methyltransferase
MKVGVLHFSRVLRARKPAQNAVNRRVVEVFDLRTPRLQSTPVNEARIAELLKPFLTAIPTLSNTCHSEERSDEEPAVLSPTQLQNISTYIDILLRWNARINLTAIRDPEDIVTRHFGESLFAARHLFPLIPSASSASSAVKALEVADIGSGAGFPGLPIKLWAPQISLTLIESNHKKAAFLKEVARALTLTDVNIQNARAEAVTARYDVVTLRAVERFETILRPSEAKRPPGPPDRRRPGTSSPCHLTRSQLVAPNLRPPIPVQSSCPWTPLVASGPWHISGTFRTSARRKVVQTIRRMPRFSIYNPVFIAFKTNSGTLIEK